MKLTQERLKELLDYNPYNGLFTYNIDRANNSKKGKIAGSLHKYSNYWIIRVDKKNYSAHRLAFLYMEGYFPENDIDHIDRNKNNNKWENLREVSRSCNMKNCNVRLNNKSKVTGVCYHKKNNKWRANINIPKNIHLGLFDNIIDAVIARYKAEIKYNFPNCNTTSSAYLYLKENS